MAVEGNLELFKLPEILQLVSQQRKTGILTVQGQQDIIAISFLDGKIVGADALNQTVEEGLSQVLVDEGLMAAAEFSRALAEQQSAGSRLVDHLVERRYVTREGLLHALRLQTSRLLEQLLGWDKGEFKFYGGDEVPYEEGFVPIAVEELLFQAGQKAAAARPATPWPVPAPAATGPRPVAAPPPPGSSPPAPVPHNPTPVPVPAAGSATATPSRTGLRVVRKEGAPPASSATRVVPGSLVAAEGERAGPFRKMKVEAPAAGPAPRPFLPKLLAAGLAGLVVAVLLTRPEALILPFPWQPEERAALAQDQRASLYLKIDRAAKTWFLHEGHFPSSLAELQQAGFLGRGDLRDPQGHPLRYTAGQESYTLEPVQGDQPIPGAETSEAITGNFLLDPELLNLPTDSTAPPLVLLD